MPLDFGPARSTPFLWQRAHRIASALCLAIFGVACGSAGGVDTTGERNGGGHNAAPGPSETGGHQGGTTDASVRDSGGSGGTNGTGGRRMDTGDASASGGTGGTGGTADAGLLGDSGLGNDAGTTEFMIPTGWASQRNRCGTATLAQPAGTWLYVGGGKLGLSVSTTDGVTWLDATTTPLGTMGGDGTRNLIRGVGYGAGMFIAVGGVDDSFISVTCDGATWRHDVLGVNIAGSPPASFAHFMSGVSYKDGVFVAVGGQVQVLRSVDGAVTWTNVSGGVASLGNYRAVAAGNGLFVAVGEDNAKTHGLSSVSTDGSMWSTPQSTTGDLSAGIAFGNGVFVAVGIMNRCAVSSDGVAWQPCTPGGTGNIASVHFAEGKFVVSYNASNYATSTDGGTWTVVSGTLPSAFARGDNRYVGTADAMRGYSLTLQALPNWTKTSPAAPAGEGIRSLVAGLVR